MFKLGSFYSKVAKNKKFNLFNLKSFNSSGAREETGKV